MSLNIPLDLYFSDPLDNKPRLRAEALVKDASGNYIEVDNNGNLKVIVDGLEINDSGQLKVVLDGKVCNSNSSATPLLAGETFTGLAGETLDYALIFVSVYTDKASATNGLKYYTSSDGVTWYLEDEFSISAATSKTFSFQPNRKYFKVAYTNGAEDQTTFDLQTIFKKTNSKASSHKIQDNISTEDDAELVKSVLTALNAAGTFVNISATKSNNLKVANVEDGLSIAKGEVTDTSFIHKFGAAPDFDTSDGIITIYDGADKTHISALRYTYSTTADIDSLSSSSNSDTFDIEVQGLDADYNVVTQIITLTGQTRVALTTPLLRVFRMKNANSSDNVGHIYCFVNTTLSSGTPTDTTKVRAVMQPLNNQTLMAVYTVPAGKTGYLRDWYASTAGASKSSNYVIELRARPLAKTFQLKHISSISDSGSSYIRHVYNEPEVFAEKTDIEMRAQATAAGASGASVSAGFDIVLVDN